MSSICTPTSASNVTVAIEGQRIHATLMLSLLQNVTALPSVATTIDSASNSNISAAFAKGISNADPSAFPSNLSIGLNSTQRGLNLRCTFDVSGVTQRSGDIVSVNMTWLPFVVRSDLRAESLSFNTIGNRYFRSVVTRYANASRFVGLPNATITGATFFVNGTSVGPPAAQDYVGNFTTLNFSPLNPDLDQWNRTYTLNNDTTTWRYFPPKSLNFEMRIGQRNVTTVYVATYGYNATISVPGIGRSKGYIIIADAGTGHTEWAMAAIVVLAFLLTIIVQIRYSNSKKRIAKFQRRQIR